MRSVIHGWRSGLCTLILIGIAGCSSGNESEAARGKTLGDSGLPTAKGLDTAPPPKDQKEWMQRKGDPYQQSGYPGTKK